MKRKLTVTAIVLLIAMAFTTVAFAAGTSTKLLSATSASSGATGYGSSARTSTSGAVTGFCTGTNSTSSNSDLAVSIVTDTGTSPIANSLIYIAPGVTVSSAKKRANLNTNTLYRVKVHFDSGYSEGTGVAHLS